MSSNKLNITPEKIKETSLKVEVKKKEFINAYNSIYTAVADMKVVYSGESSDVFIQRINEYKDEFIQASKTLEKFINFLNDYAKEAEATEGNILSSAKALRID